MAAADFNQQLNTALKTGRDPKAGMTKPQGHDTSAVVDSFKFSSPMSYKEWTDATKLDRKMRSSSLKSFDSAYKKYAANKGTTGKDLTEAQLALSCWMRKKNDKYGADGWKKSSRNQKHHAAEVMYQQLFQGFVMSSSGWPLWLPHLDSKDQREAMDFWVQQSQNLCQRYFKPANGQRLHLALNKPNTAKAAAKELINAAKEAREHVPNISSPKLPNITMPNVDLPSVNVPHVGLPDINVPDIKLPGMDLPNINLPQLNAPSVNLPAMNLPNFDIPNAPSIFVNLKNMIANFFGFANFMEMGDFYLEIMSLIKVELGGLVGDFLLDMIPVVAQIKDAAMVVAAWGKTAYSYYQQRSKEGSGIYFNSGDAAKAFDAVMKLMKRETKAQAAAATALSTKFAIDSATLGASTQASAVAKKIYDVIQRLFILGLQWVEARAVNKILKSKTKPLSYEIFKVAPITGSYMVAYGDLGDLLSMARYIFGANGWKEKVLELDKKHIQPMRKIAKKQIDGSIYCIPNFPKTKRVY